MAARLGDVVYRTACLAAVVWALFIFIVTATLALPDWTLATPLRPLGVSLFGAWVVLLAIF